MDKSQTQQVWRSFSESKVDGGFRVWEIIEVITSEEDNLPNYSPLLVKCRDGSYVLVHCSHFWTKESSAMFFREERMFYQVVHEIKNPLYCNSCSDVDCLCKGRCRKRGCPCSNSYYS